MQTIIEFVNKNKITMKCEWAEKNPHSVDSEWSKRAMHWKCLLKRGSKRMTVFYSMGSALVGNPQINNVIDSLSLDAALGMEDFEEFCSSLGFDPDNRKAFKNWQICRQSALKFTRFLGEDLIKELQECEEL